MGLWPKFSDLYVLKELDFWVKIQKSLVINATNLYDIQAQQQFLCQKWFWLSLSTFAIANRWNLEQIMWIFIQKSNWSIYLQKSFWLLSSSNIVIESFESRSCLLNKRRRHQIITHNPGILFLRTHVAGGFFLLTMPNAILTLHKSYIQCSSDMLI